MSEVKSFKERFEMVRRKSGMTNGEIARRMGVKRQALYRIKVVGNPRLKTVERIAEVMNVHPSVFFI